MRGVLAALAVQVGRKRPRRWEQEKSEPTRETRKERLGSLGPGTRHRVQKLFHPENVGLGAGVSADVDLIGQDRLPIAASRPNDV